MMLVARYDETYQKSQSLRDHAYETAIQAAENLSALGLSQLGMLTGWLHDLGKSTQAWQNALEEARQRYLQTGQGKNGPLGVPHAPLATQMTYILLHEHATTAPQKACLQILCMSLYAHHGYLMDALSIDGVEQFNHITETFRSGPEDNIDSFFDQVISKDEIERLWASAAAEVQLLLGRFRAACAHVGKSHKDAVMQALLGLVARMVYAAVIDADRLSAANHEDGVTSSEAGGEPPDWSELLASLDAHLKQLGEGAALAELSSPINQVRASISDQCKQAAAWEQGLLALHAPTGGGKTFAGLRWALARAERKGRRRVFYVVSYTTILDQVYGEYQKALNQCKVKYDLLLHHSNIIPDNDQILAGESQQAARLREERQMKLAERWDADIILSTQVQFFNAFFLGTGRAARRMRGLQNAVVIFDEVQTIPPQLTHLFNIAITFLIGLCGCDVLLSSATQPTFAQMDFPMPPVHSMFESPDKLFKGMRRVRLIDDRALGLLSAQQVAAYAFEKQEQWGSVLVVLNTRAAARRTFDALVQSERMNIELYLLSNDLCPAHRKAIIDALHNATSRPCICVSTQLIECGVDLSFGCAVRSLAGADNIWQTAGRCNRHGDGSLHPVFIIKCAEEKLDRLKDIQHAQDACVQTLHELGDADALQLPSAMTEYYRRFFHIRKSELSFPVRERGRSTTLVDLLSLNPEGVMTFAENSAGARPVWPLRQAFAEAGKRFAVIDAPTTAVIVPYHEGTQNIEELNSRPQLRQEKLLLRKAQLYTIALYEDRFRKLAADEAIYSLPCGAFALRPEWYDAEKLGLLSEPRANPDAYITH